MNFDNIPITVIEEVEIKICFLIRVSPLSKKSLLKNWRRSKR
jgi:hypothetical protein